MPGEGPLLGKTIILFLTPSDHIGDHCKVEARMTTPVIHPTVEAIPIHRAPGLPERVCAVVESEGLRYLCRDFHLKIMSIRHESVSPEPYLPGDIGGSNRAAVVVDHTRLRRFSRKYRIAATAAPA